MELNKDLKTLSEKIDFLQRLSQIYIRKGLSRKCESVQNLASRFEGSEQVLFYILIVKPDINHIVGMGTAQAYQCILARVRYFYFKATGPVNLKYSGQIGVWCGWLAGYWVDLIRINKQITSYGHSKMISTKITSFIDFYSFLATDNQYEWSMNLNNGNLKHQLIQM